MPSTFRGGARKSSMPCARSSVRLAEIPPQVIREWQSDSRTRQIKYFSDGRSQISLPSSGGPGGYSNPRVFFELTGAFLGGLETGGLGSTTERRGKRVCARDCRVRVMGLAHSFRRIRVR